MTTGLNVANIIIFSPLWQNDIDSCFKCFKVYFVSKKKKREELLVCSDYLLVGRLVLLLVVAVEVTVVAIVADVLVGLVVALVTDC